MNTLEYVIYIWVFIFGSHFYLEHRKKRAEIHKELKLRLKVAKQEELRIKRKNIREEIRKRAKRV